MPVLLPASIMQRLKEKGNVSGYIRSLVLQEFSDNAPSKSKDELEAEKQKAEELLTHLTQTEQEKAAQEAQKAAEKQEIVDLYNEWESCKKADGERARQVYIALKTSPDLPSKDKDPKAYYRTLISAFQKAGD